MKSNVVGQRPTRTRRIVEIVETDFYLKISLFNIKEGESLLLNDQQQLRALSAQIIIAPTPV